MPIEVLPPALAGGIPVAGGVIGVVPVLCLVGVLDPTPVVCVFGVFEMRAIWVRCMLEPEPAVWWAIRRLTRLRDAVRGTPFCFSKRVNAMRVGWSMTPLMRPL